jgi:hypothetical protein
MVRVMELDIKSMFFRRFWQRIWSWNLQNIAISYWNYSHAWSKQNRLRKGIWLFNRKKNPCSKCSLGNWPKSRSHDYKSHHQHYQIQKSIKIVILDDHSKVFYYPKKKKWYTANTPISLIPIGSVMTGIHSENLFYPLKNDSLTRISYRK